ncbi:MAG TPA: hypothetical protein VIJ06_01010 [Methylovirgula sp.]
MSTDHGVPFIATYSPVALAVLVAAFMAAAAALALFAMRRRPKRSVFDVGGPFDQYSKRVWPDLREGLVKTTYAGYATLWLTSWPTDRQYNLLPLPWGQPVLGVFGAAIVAVLWIDVAYKLGPASWNGWRWLRLEAEGIHWHTAESGETFRIIWRRPNGEYLFDTTIRDHRLQQELQAIRARKQRLVRTAIKAAISVALWLAVPGIVADFYNLMRPETANFLAYWEAPIFDWVMFLLAVVPNSADLAAAVAEELAYRSGAQFIPGAKVLGTRPTPISRKHIETQKAHGDASFVPAAEAVRRMAGPPQL